MDIPKWKFTEVKIDDLIPASYNPRQISVSDMRALIAGIKEFGFVEPVVLNKDLTIIGGHQRVEAAKRVGYTDPIPAMIPDALIPKDKEPILNLALNKISGVFTPDKLSALVKELYKTDFDLALTGFRFDELEKMARDEDDEKVESPEYPITPVFSEKYSYLIVFAKNEVDWTYLKNAFELENEKSYKSKEVGVGLVVTFEKFKTLLDKWKTK